MELLAVFSPLLAFVIAALLNKQIGDSGCQFVTCAAMIVAAISSAILFYDVALHGHSYVTVLAEWLNAGDLNVQWALRIDTLSVVMMCVINIVSACVHIYSVGYMSHDAAKGRFMAYLSLFTFAMLMLVSADNLLQLFFGWEGVGLASYLLIGFWNHKHSANAAAQKAFIVNRVGDLGLTLGVMAMFMIFGTIDFSSIFDEAPHKADAVFTFFGYQGHALTIACLLLFVGAVGKSAQLGLHTWLPDAMEGPTPVSALIHAATMVTAGVFLVARFSPVFEYAPAALMVVTLFGAVTAFVAATIGMTQFDIKRVIAYSTMSQLGYMFFALGVSAYGAAMFHLMTHAFFKALLFLGAGSVIHAMDGEQDMRKMGGIWKKIPITYTFMWIGSLALAGIGIPGVFGMAGFYSKDIVLEADWANGSWYGHFAFWMGIAAAFMTAFYSWRLIIMTFHGQPRADHHTMEHVHESPFVMLAPLTVLALGALFAGVVFYEPFVSGHPGHHLAEAKIEGTEIDLAEDHAVDDLVVDESHEGIHWDKATFWDRSLLVLPEQDSLARAHEVPTWVKAAPLAAGLLGIFLSYLFYMMAPFLPGFMSRKLGFFYRIVFHKYYFDEIYARVFVRAAKRLGHAFWYAGDQHVIDALGPNGTAGASKLFAEILSRLQSGFVYQYAFVMMIGVVGLMSWFFLKLSNGF